jgi:hypothetical protein
MTIALNCRNVNDGFHDTVDLIAQNGSPYGSRNGPVLELDTPLSVTFDRPRERVLFDPVRRINPFLHFFEPLWLLGGRKDVAFLENIVPRFSEFSDDGVGFEAAYGDRLRRAPWAGGVLDQIDEAIKRLRRDPNDRRTVLMIRRPDDILYNGKDAACNIAMTLKVRDGALNAHVFNRSNDVIWGGPAGGTNFPQFTVIQEYVAGHLRCALGTYTATTDNAHAYQNDQWDRIVENKRRLSDPYERSLRPFPMMTDPEAFDRDIYRVFHEGMDPVVTDFDSLFFRRVYRPMWRTFVDYKNRSEMAFTSAEHVMAEDWRDYTIRWLSLTLKTSEEVLQ